MLEKILENIINQKYNCDYIILLGITFESVLYCIVDKKKDYEYNHKERKEYIKIHTKNKQLVQMNPGNAVNLKLTLNLKDLKNINGFSSELQALFV